MTQQGDTFQRVTVAEAAAILGVSPATVRRMLKRGQLTGERVIRPQGSAFVVLLPEDASAPRGDASATRQVHDSVERSNASPDVAMTAWAASLLVPIAAELGEARQTIERQAGEVADLRERIGSLTEQVGYREHELAQSSAEIATLGDEIRMAQTARRHTVRVLKLTAAVVILVEVVLLAGTLAVAGWVL